MAPALAHAAPARSRSRLESRAAQHATARAKKPVAAAKAAPSPARTTPAKRPDICTLHEKQEPKSVALRSHKIERGDSLSVIAWRYGTSVKALAAANGITEKQTIRTGQKLVIPQHSRAGGGDDWLRYARPAKHRGRLDLYTLNQSRFVGQVVENGKLLPEAREAISNLLGAKGSHPKLSERLIRLLVRVSDTFGGRQLRVVSGYRSSSYFSDSRHKTSEAVDFSIPGIPNEVLRQYLLLLDDVGVGYYPNSSFLHLDVRGCAMSWVDYAGPGEAPRRSPSLPERPVMASKGKSPEKRGKGGGQLPRAEDLDDVAEEVAAAMQDVPKAPKPPLPEPAEMPAPRRTPAVEVPVAASLTLEASR